MFVNSYKFKIIQNLIHNFVDCIQYLKLKSITIESQITNDGDKYVYVNSHLFCTIPLIFLKKKKKTGF